MGGRIAVTPESVREYLGRAMTRDNYHLMYGLHFLSRDRFLAVMDALINGDLEPEELVRLNGFTDEDADALIASVLSGWTSGPVAVPSAGTAGYVYLTQTLGLVGPAEPTAVGAVAPHRFAGASVEVGPGAHASADEVEGIFRDLVLPAALDGLPLGYYLPADATAAAAIPVPNQDAARATHIGRLAASVYAPILGPDGPGLLGRFIQVGRTPCALRAAPGLTEWLLRAPRPGAGTKLLLHREAGARTALGEYRLEELEVWLEACETALPDHVGTARALTGLAFRTAVVASAAAHHFPERADLAERAAALGDALRALDDHRDRLRGFARRLLAGCEQHLIGTYPPA